MQKAAKLRKHDPALWQDYSKRVLELGDSFEAIDLGYILWGFGKSGYCDANFYHQLEPILLKQVPNMSSHSLMSLMWCFKRLKFRSPSVCQLVLRTALERIEDVRVNDWIKIVNSAAYLDVLSTGLLTENSRVDDGGGGSSSSSSFMGSSFLAGTARSGLSYLSSRPGPGQDENGPGYGTDSQPLFAGGNPFTAAAATATAAATNPFSNLLAGGNPFSSRSSVAAVNKSLQKRICQKMIGKLENACGKQFRDAVGRRTEDRTI